MTDPREHLSKRNPRYERFRPGMYDPPMSIFWWTGKRPYVLFILRELTSVCVALYAILLMLKLRALSSGPEAWDAVLAVFTTPFALILHLIILIAAVYHSITWFKLAPSAMVVKIGKRRLPGTLIITVNFGMWLLLSVAFGWLILI